MGAGSSLLLNGWQLLVQTARDEWGARSHASAHWFWIISSGACSLHHTRSHHITSGPWAVLWLTTLHSLKAFKWIIGKAPFYAATLLQEASSALSVRAHTPPPSNGSGTMRLAVRVNLGLTPKHDSLLVLVLLLLLLLLIASSPPPSPLQHLEVCCCLLTTEKTLRKMSDQARQDAPDALNKK